MFCIRNKMIDIWHRTYDMVQHSILQVVPPHQPHPFAFGFKKVLMAGQFSMVRYQFQINDNGFLQTHILSMIIHRKHQ